jgi:predicted dehydrogenase
MKSPISFALIGTGGIAQSYLAALENNPEAKLVAVADVREEAANTVATKMSCAAFSSHAELLEKAPPFDAVIICTPPNTHEDLVVDFAHAGKNILCEKPFTTSPESARLMVREAKSCGVLLTMASKFRYVDDVTKAKSLLASGILGDIVLFENAFATRVDMSKRWNSNPAVSGGGVLIDNGTHSVDLLRYFLGSLEEVHCVEGKRIQGLSVEDTVRVFVRSSQGVMGSVDLSWSLNKELDWYLNIYGSYGTVSLGWKESKYRQASSKDWVVFGNGYNKNQAFRSQVNNFARAIRGEEKLLIDWEDALASVDVIEAAYRSLREPNWTGVKKRLPDLTQTPRPSAPTVSFEIGATNG